MERAKGIVAALLASLALVVVPGIGRADCARVGPAKVGEACRKQSSTNQAASADTITNAPAAAARFLSLINQERSRRGLARLGRNAQLERIAYGHARDMAAAKRIYHNDALFSAATVRALGNPDELGENVGRGDEIERLHAEFMNSPSHRANILLSPYRTAGIAVVSAHEQLWVVETFMSAIHKAYGRVYTERSAQTEVAGAPFLAGPALGAWRWSRPKSASQAPDSTVTPPTDAPQVLGVKETLREVPGGAAGLLFVFAFTAVLGTAIPRRRTDGEYV